MFNVKKKFSENQSNLNLHKLLQFKSKHSANKIPKEFLINKKIN
jgi:hypothetical protein